MNTESESHHSIVGRRLMSNRRVPEIGRAEQIDDRSPRARLTEMREAAERIGVLTEMLRERDLRRCVERREHLQLVADQ